MSRYRDSVAAISDIHGNILALDAVLAEVSRLGIERIVVCGDVAAGPVPGRTIERLMTLGGDTWFIRGNADREMVAAYDAGAPSGEVPDDPALRVAAWCASRIDRNQRDFLAAFEDRVQIHVHGAGDVLFCHGSPRSDNEIITKKTPETTLRTRIAGTDAHVVVCGHTHHQFTHTLGDRRIVNAGSVGMPYEGLRGAFWTIIGPDIVPMRTEYGIADAVKEAEDAGYPETDYAELLMRPPTPDEVATLFEGVAARRGER